MSSEVENISKEPPSECSTGPVPSAPATPNKPPALKKYASSNITKKFLETQHSPSQPAVQKNASSSKLAPAPSTPHSRLVAAKLTAAPQTSNAHGWSRPGSTAPSAPISPAPSTSSANPPPGGPPQLPHVGKVIQPQPRASAVTPTTNGKPAWGNVKPSASPDGRAAALSDFPTAAEAQKATTASPKAIKSVPSPSTSDAPSNKFEADTFRGVHLNPNAHHWDEMVEGEDSDDFLGGVIEFEDGRQYQVVETNDSAPPAAPEAPVSKSERFQDDFDRSWPRRPAPGDRALFNERSNKLEPWSRGGERDRSGEPVIDLRNLGREPPPHNGPAHPVHVLPRSPVDHHGHPARSPADERPGSQWGRRRTSFASDHEPPPHRQLPPHVDRQPPPHLGGDRRDMPPPPVPVGHRPQHAPGLSTRESWTERAPPPPSRRRESFASHHTLSPDVRSVHTPLSPTGSTAPVPVAPDDLEDVRKAAMHSAAERARIRRQQEEEERAAQKERARLKALALEEKMKEAERAKEEAMEREAKEREEKEKEAAKEAEKEKPVPPPVTAPGSFSRAVRPRMPSFTRDAPPPMTRTPSQRSVARTPAEEASHWRVRAAPLAPRPPRPVQQPSSPTIARISPVIAQRSSASTSPVVERPPPPPAPGHSDLFSVAIDESVEEVDFADMHTLVGAEGKPAEPTEPTKTEDVLPSQATPTLLRRQRPVASDYFDAEPQPAPASKSDLESTWRRKAPEPAPAPTPAPPPPAETTEHLKPPSSPRAPLSPSRSAFREASMSSFEVTMARIKSGMNEAHEAEEKLHPHAHGKHPSVNLPAVTVQEVPQANKWVPPALRAKQSYNGAAPIAHVHPTTKPTPTQHAPHQPAQQRLSPAIEPEPIITQQPRPPSPKPAWNVHPVHLPHTSRPREPLTRKQVYLNQQKSNKIRWDILSFDPPVEGMNIKDLSVVPILFRTPLVGSSIKGKMKYAVNVPTKRLESVGPPASEAIPAPAQASKPAPVTSPKVNLGAARSAAPAPAPVPAPAPTSIPAPIQRPSADRTTSSNWRERAPLTSTSFAAALAPGLETVSRSPPPEMTSTAPAPSSEQITAPTQVPVSDATKVPQPKPKLADGESLGFYRRDSIGSSSVARFIVNSELGASEAKVNGTVASDGKVVTESKDSARTVEAVVEHKAESKSSDGSSDQAPLTPPSSTWPNKFSVKESPARAPDPEHLKLLWQQPPEKLDVPAINSLKGIADVDMPVVNFTLQEVKSEDGETPPPTMSSAPAAPHPRMSLHDVTRAFQQVPTPSPAPNKSAPSTSASASTSSHIAVSPGGAPSTPIRGFVPPGPPGAMRPAYAAYPSPMMGPAPTPVMYPMMAPSPVPGPHPHAPHQMVSGPQPMYGQPMWVPVPGPQTPNMRPGPVPYPQPGSYMYAPGPQPGMYPAPPPQQQQQQHPQQPNGTPGKRVVSGPQAQMMSPAMGHAHPPMYSGSPALMHAPPQGFGPPRTPAPAPMGPYGAPMMHHPGGPPPPGPYGAQAAYGPRPPTW